MSNEQGCSSVHNYEGAPRLGFTAILKRAYEILEAKLESAGWGKDATVMSTSMTSLRDGDGNIIFLRLLPVLFIDRGEDRDDARYVVIQLQLAMHLTDESKTSCEICLETSVDSLPDAVRAIVPYSLAASFEEAKFNCLYQRLCTDMNIAHFDFAMSLNL